MLRSTLMIVLVAFGATAYADGLNYTYIQASYGQVEVDDPLIDVDGDGFGIDGSMALTENFHLFGEYQTADMDFNVDLNLLEAGIGYNIALSETVDVVGRVAYVNAEIEAFGVSDDENGYSIGAHLRGQVGSMIELNGGLDYVDLDESETRAKAGIRFSFTENFSAGLNGTWWDDVNIYQLNARFSF